MKDISEMNEKELRNARTDIEYLLGKLEDERVIIEKLLKREINRIGIKQSDSFKTLGNINTRLKFEFRNKEEMK